MQKIDVGILGATGTVGQQFIALLADHPWFRVTWLAASERSAGKRYGDLAWRLPSALPAEVARLEVSALDALDQAPSVLFSALDSSVAGEAETAYAASGRLVVSNAKNHRMDPLVPLLIPEVNPDHLSLLDDQRKARGLTGIGGIVTNPNCSVINIALVLAALRPFEPTRMMITTLQALSGAGYPGVASLDALGNVIPYIGGGEEEKIETEANKILGAVKNGRVENHPVTVSAAVTRVPVQNGHTESIAVALEQKPDPGAIIAAWDSFRGKPQDLELPSAPPQPIVYLTEQNRPQPSLDANRDGGMTVTVGRLRRCPVLDYKFAALGHNTIRGAAGAAILNAELMSREGLL
jgi:aspartate-semialdehyde dehydrogenase